MPCQMFYATSVVLGAWVSMLSGRLVNGTNVPLSLSAMATMNLEVRWAISGTRLSAIKAQSNDLVRQLEEKILPSVGAGQSVKLVCEGRILAPHERVGDVLSSNSILDVVCRRSQVGGPRDQHLKSLFI